MGRLKDKVKERQLGGGKWEKRERKMEIGTDRQIWDEHMEGKDREAFIFYTVSHHPSRSAFNWVQQSVRVI